MRLSGKAQTAAVRLAEELLDCAESVGVKGATAGISAVPVAAELAARAVGLGEVGGAESTGTKVNSCGDGDQAGAAEVSEIDGVVSTGAAAGLGADVGGRTGAAEVGEVDRAGSTGEAVGLGSDGGGGQADWIRALGAGERVTVVEPGQERAFLAGLPLELLGPDEQLLSLLEGVGIVRCGELASLDREAVEVRFGDAGAALWRLACADDTRRIFAPFPRERPHASLDFVDYVLTDPARLVFTANALLGNICEALRGRGEHAQRMTLALGLANGEVWRRSFRPARPTARREVWLRLVRAELERLTVPDAVAGVSLEVESVEPAAVHQGDLFDRGFATATAVEAALERLTDAHGPVVVAPELSAHPLPELRTRWIPRDSGEVVEAAPDQRPLGNEAARGVSAAGAPAAGVSVARAPASGVSATDAPPTDIPAVDAPATGIAAPGAPAAGRAGLTLQLLPSPQRIAVESVPRRDHIVPVRYRRKRDWLELIVAAGPDRISGGEWEAPYAREYFRCVDADGVLFWIFRDVREEGWYLHGWWG